MSEERTSPTPNAPRCPVCATGYTATPGANCPACGRSDAAMALPPEYDFRLRTERRRLDGPPWIVLGVVLSCCGLLLAVALALALEMPGVLIPLGILVVLALVRTARLAPGRRNGTVASLFTLFLAALGVSMLAGAAAGAACFAVCIATFVISSNFTNASGPAFLAGGVTALLVFVWRFAVFWPRADPVERDPGED